MGLIFTRFGNIVTKDNSGCQEGGGVSFGSFASTGGYFNISTCVGPPSLVLLEMYLIHCLTVASNNC